MQVECKNPTIGFSCGAEFVIPERHVPTIEADIKAGYNVSYICPTCLNRYHEAQKSGMIKSPPVEWQQ